MNDAMGMPQSAVVVGGTSDIARAVLRALVARRLRRIVLAGRDEIGLATAAKELLALGALEVDTATLDVTDVGRIPVVVRDASARLGQVDLVLVAAGVLGDQATDEARPRRRGPRHRHQLDRARRRHRRVRAGAAHQGHGRVVVLTSVAGVRVRRANYVYGASKAGLDAFAQGMAEALRGSGASLMIDRPGWVATRMTEGRDPAPLATTPDAVAADVVAGMERSAPVVWSPAHLRLVFAVLRLLPAGTVAPAPG